MAAHDNLKNMFLCPYVKKQIKVLMSLCQKTNKSSYVLMSKKQKKVLMSLCLKKKLLQLLLLHF